MTTARIWLFSMILGALLAVGTTPASAQPLECYRCSWVNEPGWCEHGFYCVEVDPLEGDPNGRTECDTTFDSQCSCAQDECEHSCTASGEPCEPPHEEQAIRVGPDGSINAGPDASVFTLRYVPVGIVLGGSPVGGHSLRDVSCAGVVFARRYAPALAERLREESRFLAL